jgi:hypothetical protein
MKDQIIINEDDLEDNLTNVWEVVSRDLLESVFHERVSKPEWTIEHDDEYYLNPSQLNENCIYSFPGSAERL